MSKQAILDKIAEVSFKDEETGDELVYVGDVEFILAAHEGEKERTVDKHRAEHYGEDTLTNRIVDLINKHTGNVLNDCVLALAFDLEQLLDAHAKHLTAHKGEHDVDYLISKIDDYVMSGQVSTKEALLAIADFSNWLDKED